MTGFYRLSSASTPSGRHKRPLTPGLVRAIRPDARHAPLPNGRNGTAATVTAGHRQAAGGACVSVIVRIGTPGGPQPTARQLPLSRPIAALPRGAADRYNKGT